VSILPPLRALILVAAAAAIAGCTTSSRKMWDDLKGEGFSGWSEELGSGVRPAKNAKPSGFFTDRRSEQIEKDLGGF
jgi:hypothetical protein